MSKMILGFAGLNLSQKAIYFAIAGLIGACAGALVGEIPFSLARTAGVELSENIIEIQKRVETAGGKSGPVQISLMWNNRNDLDLHVFDPDGAEIWFRDRKSRSGGELDVDRNVNGETATPVENVVWVNSAPDGEYGVYVDFFAQHGQELRSPYVAVIQNRGETLEFHGEAVKVGERLEVHRFVTSDSGRGGRQVGAAWFVGTWALCVSIGISLFLVVGQRKYLRQPLFRTRELLLAAGGGAIAGGFSGMLANSLFVVALPRALSWGLMGLILGVALTKVIPNLKPRPAALGGLSGGILGGTLFVVVSSLLGQTTARIGGAAAIGFCVGLMIAIIEEYCKDAWLEIHWGSGEQSSVGLGQKPIVLGSSSDANIYLPKSQGFPPLVGRVTFDSGRIAYEDFSTKKRSELKNGSKIQMGKIEVFVRLK